MKKIALQKSIGIWALMPWMLWLVGCSNSETIEKGGTSNREVNLRVTMPDKRTTRAGLEEEYYSKDLVTRWHNQDEIQLFITQDKEHYEIGKVGVTNISEDKKTGAITFNLPGGLKMDEPFSVHGLSGIEGTMVGGDDGKWYPLCTAELERNDLDHFEVPMYCKLDVVDGSIGDMQFKVLGTYEVLHLNNATDEMISFKHRGFDVEKPWYLKKVVGYLLPDGAMDLLSEDVTYGDNESEAFNIQAGLTESLLSWYIPNGELMKGAELKATINGNALKSSNKKSSKVAIQTGQAYHMYATWDGTSLKFDNGDIKTLSVDREEIDFKSVKVDEAKKESFTVTNTGNVEVSFEVESMHSNFDIEESGMPFTLESGEAKTFIVTFTPSETDQEYEAEVNIRSDASNGPHHIGLKGKGATREEERLNQVVPDELREKLEEHLPIYDGSNPPNIENEYIMSPAVLSFDSDYGLEVGYEFNDVYLKFYNQDMTNNTLDFAEREKISTSTGTGCFISGEGSNFSVYFNTEGQSRYDKYTVYTKTALVISGTLTNSGIKNIYYGFIMVEKSSDPENYVMNVGDYRVVTDRDGMTYIHSWWNNAKKYAPQKDKQLPSIYISGR